jgi:hypothetical protein
MTEMTAESENGLDDVMRAAQFVLARYGEHVAALMAYGSRVYGEARRGSAYDFWLIVRDLEAFHYANADFYKTQLNIPSTPEEQIRMNRTGPLFYSMRDDDHEIKLAVLDEHSFADLCVHEWWAVKGRMQKPLRAIRTTPLVETAILAARREGLVAAVNLLPREFTIKELITEIVGLSYRAEVRPERIRAKVLSIVQAGREPLKEIYLPLLEELPFVKREGGRLSDLRTDADRRRARHGTLGALNHSKWCRRSLRFVWRNFRSYSQPVRYLCMKLAGEVEKAVTHRNSAKN